MVNTGISLASLAYKSSLSSAYSPAELTSVEKSKADSSVANLPKPNNSGPEINDEAIISDEAKTLLAQEQANSKNESANSPQNSSKEQTDAKSNMQNALEELTPQQKSEVVELKARDLEVKAHEQAHLSAASGINASAPSYSYQTGPDGKRYAVGGEVSISFTQSENPAENIAKAQAMKAAALAPADPSGQDLNVARSADQIIAQARQDLAEQKDEQVANDSESEGPSTEETSGTIADASDDKKDNKSDVEVGVPTT